MFGIGFAEYEPTDGTGFVKTVVVANYFPCGNIQGKFKDNVLEPSDKSGGIGDKQSTIQRKINQYQKKKERIAKKPAVLGGGRKKNGPGNLGLSTSMIS